MEDTSEREIYPQIWTVNEAYGTYDKPRNPDLVDKDVHPYDTLGKQSFRHKSRWMIVIALVVFFIIACAIVIPVTVKILEDAKHCGNRGDLPSAATPTTFASDNKSSSMSGITIPTDTSSTSTTTTSTSTSSTTTTPTTTTCPTTISEPSSCNFAPVAFSTSPDLIIDLSNGQVTGTVSSEKGFEWVTIPSFQGGARCNYQAVLKMTYNTSNRKRAQIDLTFDPVVTSFTFNIGDSETNNAYGGDAYDNANCAEIHDAYRQFWVWGKAYQDGANYGTLYYRDAYVADNITINVADELVTAYNGKEFAYLNSFKLFALSGQAPGFVGYVNYDVYFGMNRVISSNFRSGTGLCRVAITWSDTLPTSG